MTNANLIKVRDNLLDRITGKSANQVLNPYVGELQPELGPQPAAAMKKSLDMIKMAAIAEDGIAVDYALLPHDPAYVEFHSVSSPSLMGFDPASLSTRQEKMAFWINLYNALVLNAVMQFGVQHSVTEGRLGIMSFFRRAAYNVGGYRVSADDIEHGILRSNKGHPYLPGAHFAQDDPCQEWVISPLDVRIHFALNCASRSCPPIQTYSADQLESQLELAAKNFVNNHVEIDPARQTMTASAIFRWYQGDFGGRMGVLRFITDHLPEDGRREWLAGNQNNVRIRYDPYDWGLNAIKTQPSDDSAELHQASQKEQKPGNNTIHELIQQQVIGSDSHQVK
jgi:hypothetical protein